LAVCNVKIPKNIISRRGRQRGETWDIKRGVGGWGKKDIKTTANNDNFWIWVHIESPEGVEMGCKTGPPSQRKWNFAGKGMENAGQEKKGEGESPGT